MIKLIIGILLIVFAVILYREIRYQITTRELEESAENVKRELELLETAENAVNTSFAVERKKKMLRKKLEKLERMKSE